MGLALYWNTVDRDSLLDLQTPSFFTGMPARIIVRKSHIEVFQFKSPVETTHQRVRYEQVAQVAVIRRILLARLVIETRGGHTLMVDPLWKKDAEVARNLIEERTGVTYLE